MLGNAQPVEFEDVNMPDAVIRYTIDGTEPTPQSPEYRGSIRLNRAGVVKAAVFRPTGTKSDTVSIAAISIKADDSPKIQGVNRKVLLGEFKLCPDISQFTSLGSKNVAEVGLGEMAGKDNYALHFEGYIRIPADGEYIFNLASDDGSKMWIGESLVVNHDGTHPYLEKRLRVRLPKGDYPFRIIMFEATGDDYLRLFVEGAGMTKQLIPASWLWSKAP